MYTWLYSQEPYNPRTAYFSYMIILGRNDKKLGKTPPSSPCAGMHANQQRAHQLPHHAHWLPLATISFQPCLPAFGETIDIYRDFFVIIYPFFCVLFVKNMFQCGTSINESKL